MFERFTEKAIKVIMLAQEEARRLGHNFVGTEQILLEVSQGNVTAEIFYSRFDFSTVGIRKNYYKDGSHALLKEKKLTTK